MALGAAHALRARATANDKAAWEKGFVFIKNLSGNSISDGPKIIGRLKHNQS
ncbi:hypothetical protein TV01_1954 [Neisseria flavescens]|nr:hypothetical protein TV01_1954 [Neisseria flavescens]